MADRPQKVVDIFVDERYTSEQRQRIAEEMIRYIKRRTSRGRGIDNKPFQQEARFAGGRDNSRTYTDSYQDTQEFKISGKRKSPINLRLTGEMLDSLEVLDVSLQGRIQIGYDNAGFDSDKAWFNEEKGYRFLDVSERETERVSRGAVGTARGDAAAISQELANEIARNLFESES